jgi:diacylglycerol kinase family enzyme
LAYDTDEGPATKGFIVIGGAGYDATIMESSERLKEALGPGAYVAAAITNPSPTIARFSIHLDDRTVEIDSMAVLVLNFAKIYPDISISYNNDARDGLFEIAVLKPHTAVELLPALLAALLERGEGSPYRADVVEIFKSKSVRVESDPPLHLQYDGEAPGCKTPFVARILPAATRLVVTEQEFLRLSKG